MQIAYPKDSAATIPLDFCARAAIAFRCIRLELGYVTAGVDGPRAVPEMLRSLARGHLRAIWSQARSGIGDPRDVLRYRLAFVGLVVSAIYIIGWQVSIGMSLVLSIALFVLTTLIYFLIAKLVAATGFSYLLPHWDHMKGKSFILDLVGTNRIAALRRCARL